MKKVILLLTVLMVLFGYSVSHAGPPQVATIWTYATDGSTTDWVANPDPTIYKTKVYSNIYVVFNEEVLWGTVFNTGVYRINIFDEGTGALFKSLTYSPASNNAWYLLAQTSNFKPDTSYRIRVSELIRSTSTEQLLNGAFVDGVEVGTPFEFIFHTENVSNPAVPTVVSSYPLAGSTDIPLDTKVLVGFSEPMDASTITNSNIIIEKCTDTPACSSWFSIASTISYDDSSNSATITPDVPLTKSSTYRTRVTTSVRDIGNQPLTSDVLIGFSTVLADTVAPFVRSTLPINGATGVATGTVSITFSEPVDQTTLNAATIVVKQGGSAVAGTIGYDEATATVSFIPAVAFGYAKDYTVSVTTGVRDLAGNNLSPGYNFKFTTLQASAPAPMSAYSHVPPFVAGAGVPPNVLMIVDNSGSMDERAYADNYSTGKSYYGYFDPDKMYIYNSTGKRFEATAAAKDTGATTLSTSTAASGNFLNWLATRRIDAVRMALVGGVKNTGNERTYYAGPQFNKAYGGISYRVLTSSQKPIIRRCENANCSSTTDFQAVVYITDTERAAKPGLIRQFEGQMRLGMMFFNDGYNFENKGGRDGGVVQIDIGQTGADFVTQVLNTPASTWTPLGETLYEATRYFGATTSAYNGGTYSGKKPIEHHCQRNFVLILTDGESTKDRNVPGGYWKSYNGGNPFSDADFNVKDYLLGNAGLNIKGIRQLEPKTAVDPTSVLPTDPWNTKLNDMEGTWYLPGVAYYAHKKDLRSDMSGLQNLTIYTVFAFDDSKYAEQLLKLTAKYGGFDDTDGSGAPDAAAKWDKNGDGIPDTYFRASDGDALEKQLKKAFEDILARVSSGTAASILNNSEGSGANLLQAVFYPKKTFDDGTEVSWIGEMQNLWYYLDPYLVSSSVRVDTVKDNILDLKKDKIALFEFDNNTQQTVVRLSDDANGDGVADGPWLTFSPDDTANVRSLWRAGRLLWERNLSTNPRTIYTRTGGITDVASKSFDASTTGLTLFSNQLQTGYGSKLTTNPLFQVLLQAANETEADKLVKYIHGVPENDVNGNMTDVVGYRSRLVDIGGQKGIWRLGDIVSSTPKLLANIPLNTFSQPVPTGYADGSYDRFVKSSAYQTRGMVFVGSNDGMLHAFKLGTLQMINDGSSKKAQLVGTDLGQEQWSFIPRNMLPYLRYLADPQYSHLFYVDGSTTLVDVAIHRPDDNDTYKLADNNLMYPNCSDSQYWNCIKKTTYGDQTTKTLDNAKTSWRTVLIGSTGLGGAGRNKATSGFCYEKTGTDCVKTPVDGTGFSTYYALDVTDPTKPKFMWEFNGDPAEGVDADKKGGNLGYATSGPVIVRVGDKNKNGRWFAVFASGPTGPIDADSRQFLGRSDQPLKLFVVDIGTGALVRTIDTGIAAAFSGSLSNGAIDTDKSKPYSPGFYSDDAIYVGYTKKSSNGAWDLGGVGRILTHESTDPTTWEFSRVIEGTDIGPVTSAVTKLQDRGNGNLWLYFGTGRYFFKTSAGIDDPISQRRIYGIKEPCYSADKNDINQECGDTPLNKKAEPEVLKTSDLQDQTLIKTFDSSKAGWYINLDPSVSTVNSERVITDPVASPNGVVFFTTFQPNSNVCSYGGGSYIWAVDYKSGGTPSARAMGGKLLMQVSTGAFAEFSMATAFSGKDGRRTGSAVQGVPPKAQGLSLLTNPKPVKKIMHVQEK